MNCSYEAPADRPSKAEVDRLLSRLENVETQLSKWSGQNKNKVLDSASLPASCEDSCSPIWLKSSTLFGPQRLEPVVMATVDRILKEKRLTSRQVIDGYYKTIQIWFPVVPESVFRLSLDPIHVQQSIIPKTLTLFMMLNLGNEPTLAEGETVEQLPSLYLTCKSLFSVLMARGETSVWFIQAGLLVALFEYTQGLTDAAYVTLGICAKTSSLWPTQNNELDEHNRARWGIAILERCMNICAGENPLNPALGDLGNEQPLPTKGHCAHGEWFSLEAEATWNLGKVQAFIRESDGKPAPELLHGLHLDHSLTALLCKLQTYQSDSVLFVAGFATVSWHVLTLISSSFYYSTNTLLALLSFCILSIFTKPKIPETDIYVKSPSQAFVMFFMELNRCARK